MMTSIFKGMTITKRTPAGTAGKPTCCRAARTPLRAEDLESQ